MLATTKGLNTNFYTQITIKVAILHQLHYFQHTIPLCNQVPIRYHVWPQTTFPPK